MLLKILSKSLLNIDRHGSSITSIGSLLQCLTTLPVEKFFITSSLNLPWGNFLPFLCILSSVTKVHRPVPLTPPPQEFVKSNKVTSQLSVLQTRKLVFSSDLSLLSQHMPSSSFTSFVALLWIISRTLTSFL